MDWLDEFKYRFSKFPELGSIKKDKLHGSLTINFSDGIAQNYDLKIHRLCYRVEPSTERKER